MKWFKKQLFWRVNKLTGGWTSYNFSVFGFFCLFFLLRFMQISTNFKIKTFWERISQYFMQIFLKSENQPQLWKCQARKFGDTANANFFKTGDQKKYVLKPDELF